MKGLGPRAAGAPVAMEVALPTWNCRGYLPHFDASDIWQFVTYRLADAMPRQAVERMAAALTDLPPEERPKAQRQRIERWLDAGRGSCLLGRTDIAAIIEENLHYHAGASYHLGAWVIMPNHVHVLVRIIEGHRLENIVRSWKSYTAKRIMAVAGCASPVWWHDYWDRFIRNEDHFNTTWRYVEENPVSAGLVETAERWRWGSAFERTSGARSQGES